MPTSDQILYCIFTILGFVIGLVFLKVFPNIPYIKFDPEVDIVSTLSLFITTIFAVGIPLFLKKLIDDNRGIKSFLEREISEIIRTAKQVGDTILECYKNDKITPEDKDHINYIFDTLELQIASLEEQVCISFKKKGPGVVKAIKDAYFTYNDHVTGGSLMNSKFIKIEDDFRRSNDTELNKLVTVLKNAIHEIHKF